MKLLFYSILSCVSCLGRASLVGNIRTFVIIMTGALICSLTEPQIDGRGFESPLLTFDLSYALLTHTSCFCYISQLWVHRKMTTLRPFKCDDLLKFNSVNLDPLTETYNLAFYLMYLSRWVECAWPLNSRENSTMLVMSCQISMYYYRCKFQIALILTAMFCGFHGVLRSRRLFYFQCYNIFRWFLTDRN